MEGRIKSLIYHGRRHLPLPTGPYSVGCCDVMTSYSRFGVFARLYYPATGNGILDRYLQWPLWMPNKEYLNGYASKIGVHPQLYNFLFKTVVGKLFIPAIWQANLLQSSEKYPVVVFSHGLSGWRTVYSSICLELASYGFVVAAVEHRDYSASASFYKKQARMSTIGEHPGICLKDLDAILENQTHSDIHNIIAGDFDCEQDIADIGPFCHAKEWLIYQTPVKGNESIMRSQQMTHRAKECSQMLDLFEDLNKGRLAANILDPSFDLSMFCSQLDLNKAFFIGHSFGGATGILCMDTESRFRATVLLDPWMFPFYDDQTLFSTILKPFLCLSVKSFQNKESLLLLKMLNNMNLNSSTFYVLKDAKHSDLSDVPFIKRYFLSLRAKLGLRIQRFSVHDLVCHVMLEYLGQHLGKTFLCKSEKIEYLKKKYLRAEEYIDKLLTKNS